MIVSETTRVYTNSKGEQEKVDVLRSYRKVGVTKTIISETNDNGAHFLMISLKAVSVLALIYGLISVIIPLFIPISTTKLADISISVENEQIKQFSMFLKQHQIPYFLQQYYLRAEGIRKSHEDNQSQKLERQILDNLQCWWQSNRILCEIMQHAQDYSQKLPKHQDFQQQ